MKKEKIILLGGGGHCKSVIDVIEQEGRFEIAGIVEKFEGESAPIFGYPLIGTDDELATLREQYSYAFITIGHIASNAVRKKLFSKLKELDFTIPTIISPLSYVSPHATLQEGTVIMHHAIVNAAAKVGKNCIINTKVLIEHDSSIEDNCHVSTGAIINGGVQVMQDTFIGSGTTTKQSICVSGFIKAGSIVK
ncbi:NeuD/PglB/VioB family sugar acetyltransferase [Sulfurimonas paralvinellae]|uniref:Acetyltransferase n=1 Tax=Sulfurimonas paralvinellae TaxID=317658 RepID=A0A7M1B5G0_9BACT|nr:NeuD/PglB/VioB family sugar acetyltransferase [Sulfurimonas paralvinellae]QOP44885.1 acetyltransferase [Sulfurimonas paralvinellae]